MKLQAASKKEIKRIAIGSALCLALMLVLMYVLTLLGVGTFHYTVVLAGLAGALVAVLNFTVLCLTIQKAAETEDKKLMKARFQVSYNARLILQAAWIVAAFFLFSSHVLAVVAAALPLLFPTAVIWFLQARGKLVTPSDRANPVQPEEEEQERLDSFEA